MIVELEDGGQILVTPADSPARFRLTTIRIGTEAGPLARIGDWVECSALRCTPGRYPTMRGISAAYNAEGEEIVEKTRPPRILMTIRSLLLMTQGSVEDLCPFCQPVLHEVGHAEAAHNPAEARRPEDLCVWTPVYLIRSAAREDQSDLMI